MASFSDNLGALTNFNPYVQQLPVEAMVSVGQQKQQQYNEGVQKIQSHIDQVAGMDVVRDIDKQYLQSKLNTLGSDLKKVAAGDFSNYQLVNSVSGMASKIGKDPVIVNAVGSTAKYRKGLSEMETAIKEGKSSPSNEYYFNKQASAWLNNSDPKASFNGGYRPYTNWKKNALEVLKSVTKDESITEDAFTVDPSTGQLVIADAIVQKKMAGIDPAKVQQALMVGLTPADFQQMEMDGVYNYANLDAPRFQKSVASAHSNTIGFYENQKKVLENAKMSTTSVAQKEKLDDQIAALDRTIKQVSNEYQDIASAIEEGNLDAAKARYFTRNALDGFSKAFSYTETSQTYKSSPFAEAARWRETKDMEWKKFKLNYDQQERHFQVNTALKGRELELKQQEASGYGGLPMTVPQDQVPQYTLERVVTEIEAKEKELASADEAFMRQNGGDRQWFEQQKAAYEKNPKGVEPEIALHFNETERQRRRLAADITMVANISAEADRIYGTQDKFIPKDYPSIESDGLIYSPKEIVDFNTKFGKYIKAGPGTINSAGFGGSSRTVYDYEKARQDMTPKEYRLFEMMGGIIPKDKNLLNAVSDLSNKVNQPFSKTLDSKMDYTADEITKRVTSMQGVEYGIETGKPELRKQMATNLNTIAKLADSQSGGLANSPDFDSDTARKLALDPEATYSMKIVEGTEKQPEPIYELTVSGNDGTVTARLSPEQKRSVFGNRFEAAPQVAAIRPYQEQIKKMGGYTTNLAGGKSTPDTAFLGKIDFPSVNIYGIKGDIIEPQKGVYAIKINVYDPFKQKWIENISAMGSNVITENAILHYLQTLNDAAIYELINNEPATAQDLKALEQASKNQ